MNGFGNTLAHEAKHLSRNPLGIIALFILLVYGMAGLTLAVSSHNMQPNERLPLVWFLVVFPGIVLLAFCFLVTRHHTKLYAPGDFGDRDGFFRALSPAQQRQQLEAKLKEITADAEQPSKDETTLGGKEQRQSASAFSARHKYMLAEDMTFREIESEFNVRIDRHMMLPNGQVLDGVFIHNRFPVIIDISYIQSPSKARIPAIHIEQLRMLKHATGLPASFLLIVVSDGLNAEQGASEKERLQKAAQEAHIDVDVRVYDFDLLRKKYGI